MEDQKDTKNVFKTTLGKLKNKLPIEVKSKADQTFTFKSWGMTEEKKLAKLKDKNPSMGRFVSAVLKEMLTTLHGEDFEGLDEKDKGLILNQLPMGSVLYMYLYLRYDQLGPEINLQFDCPYCDKKIKDFIANIEDMDVDCKTGNYDDVEIYKLRKPITLDAGNQLVEALKIGIGKWDIMESADRVNSNDEATMKEHSFRRCIVGVEGVDTQISPDSIIKKLLKIDIEGLHSFISNHNGGPSVQAEIECPVCSAEFSHTIDWRYESFFGIGSLPQQ